MYFNCNVGVRQGENLSPFLFSIFLNDLESHFLANSLSGIRLEAENDEFIRLYADDTVIYSDNESDMQHAWNTFEDYCSEWKLTVNIEKTKLMIFGQQKINANLKYIFNRQKIEIVKESKYLGILLGQRGSFLTTKKFIAEQASKAMFCLLRKIKPLQLPLDIQIDLFNKIVKPVLLYGFAVCGFGNLYHIERVELRYFKYISNLKNSTTSAMIYGELGVMPIAADIKCRVITFWSKIIGTEESNKLSHENYKIIYVLQESNRLKSQWISN